MPTRANSIRPVITNLSPSFIHAHVVKVCMHTWSGHSNRTLGDDLHREIAAMATSSLGSSGSSGGGEIVTKSGDGCDEGGRFHTPPRVNRPDDAASGSDIPGYCSLYSPSQGVVEKRDEGHVGIMHLVAHDNTHGNSDSDGENDVGIGDDGGWKSPSPPPHFASDASDNADEVKSDTSDVGDMADEVKSETSDVGRVADDENIEPGLSELKNEPSEDEKREAGSSEDEKSNISLLPPADGSDYEHRDLSDSRSDSPTPPRARDTCPNCKRLRLRLDEYRKVLDNTSMALTCGPKWWDTDAAPP